MQSSRRKLYILFFTLIVVMMGFGIIIPILPFYIDEFGAGGRELGLLMATFALMQFIFAPIWGQISDARGRKPVLLIGVFGNAISMVLFGLSSELWMLFASRILAGILSSATLPTAMAYVGDSTSKEDRGAGMGLMGAAMGIGMVLGPGLGGWLAVSSLSLPFFVAAGLSMGAMVLIALFLPESLPPENRTTRSRSTPVISQFKEVFAALFSPIGIPLILAFLLSFGLTSFEAVFGLWALDRYGFGTREVGIILTGIGLTSAVVQGGMTGPLTRRFGEMNIIKVSFVGSALGFALLLFASNLITVILTASFFIIFNSLLRPAIAALISIRSTGGQGVAMGLDNSAMSLGRVVGPIWAGSLYDNNMTYPYLSGSIVMMIGFVISLLGLKGVTPSAQPVTPVAEDSS